MNGQARQDEQWQVAENAVANEMARLRRKASQRQVLTSWKKQWYRHCELYGMTWYRDTVDGLCNLRSIRFNGDARWSAFWL